MGRGMGRGAATEVTGRCSSDLLVKTVNSKNKAKHRTSIAISRERLLRHLIFYRAANHLAPMEVSIVSKKGGT